MRTAPLITCVLTASISTVLGASGAEATSIYHKQMCGGRTSVVSCKCLDKQKVGAWAMSSNVP